MRGYWTRIAWLVCWAVLVLQPFPAGAQQSNPEVDYFVLGEKYPRGLSDFQAFGLFRQETKSGRPRYSGWLMTDREHPDRSTSAMKALRLTGRRLSFTATTRAGLVMTFDGRFLRGGDLRPFFNKDIPVVEGVARKFRKGRKVAEGKMRFTCGTGD
jgi:hypothetical protein